MESVLILCFLVQAQELPLRGEELARIAAEGELNNRESMPYLDCRFTIAVGKVRDVDSAVRHGVQSERVATKGIWLFNGKKARFEIAGDGAFVEQNLKDIGNGQATLPIGPEKLITDGETCLLYSPVTKGASLITRGRQIPGAALTPLNMGVMGASGEFCPGNVIKSGLSNDEMTIECRQVVDIHGAELIDIQLLHRGANTGLRYVLDPSQGYLPVEISDTDPATERPRMKLFITEARELESGSWIPTRSVSVMSFESKDGLGIREIVVDRIEDRVPPPDSELAIVLPAGSRINDGVDISKRIRITADRTIRSTDLPALVDELARSDRSISIANEHNTGGTLAKVVVFINVVIVLFLLGIYVHRRAGSMRS